MSLNKNSMLFATFIASAFYVLITEASPYVISDDRARSLDITPVLGRGYAIGTNSYHSTCMMSSELTTPSYNYDYTFTDFSSTSSGSSEAERGASYSLSFGYYAVKAKVDYNLNSQAQSESSRRMITSTMRIERYYSSIREELSSLTDDALTLLDRQDYIGFFKGCGPNYIRSIRRAQEITAIFEFEETSSERASEFAYKVQASANNDETKTRSDVRYVGCFRDRGSRALGTYKGSGKSVSQCAQACKGYTYLGRQASGQCFCGNSGYDRYGKTGGCNCDGRYAGSWRNCVYEYIQRKVSYDVSYKSTSKSSSAEKTLIITILGYGLGLGTEGASSLVSTNLEEYQDVMKFAFKSFTQTEMGTNIGMVYGFELVPWVDNIAFQIASKVMDEEVIIPLPRSLIPRAQTPVADPPTTWVNDGPTRNLYTCKNAPFHKDKYGYCCEADVLWDPALQIYSTELQNVTVSGRVCRPSSRLDKSVVKNNMSNNGEFVAHLDALVRMKINNLFTLEKCISAIKTVSARQDYNILKHQDTILLDKQATMDFTVKEMKIALDPLNNFSLLKAVGEELDEWVDMYYQPCIAALFGMNIGSNPDVESQYFLAYGWLSHSACMRLSCLADNMRWDRATNGCSTSLLVGINAEEYGAADLTGVDAYCSKDNSLTNITDIEEEKCKYDQTLLFNLQQAHNQCFACGISPAAVMNMFCMPVLTANTASVAKLERVRRLEEICDWIDNPNVHWTPDHVTVRVGCHEDYTNEYSLG